MQNHIISNAKQNEIYAQRFYSERTHLKPKLNKHKLIMGVFRLRKAHQNSEVIRVDTLPNYKNSICPKFATDPLGCRWTAKFCVHLHCVTNSLLCGLGRPSLEEIRPEERFPSPYYNDQHVAYAPYGSLAEHLNPAKSSCTLLKKQKFERNVLKRQHVFSERDYKREQWWATNWWIYDENESEVTNLWWEWIYDKKES